MAESLVNPVSAAQLSPRNQEPTHLSGGDRDELGDATDSKLDYAGKLKPIRLSRDRFQRSLPISRLKTTKRILK